MGRPSDARERLIEAARAVIFTHSYESVSIDELCAAAGVHKSSFYHFFASKQELVLASIEVQWQSLDATLKQTFAAHIPPPERFLRFFELTLQQQMELQQRHGQMRGCPAGNLTLELSTQNEPIRVRLQQLFQQWLAYFEQALDDARAERLIPSDIDTATTAQALLAYFEGVLLLAKGQNNPALITTLRPGVLALMHYQEKADLSLNG
ncbi:TetR/AcrR family transcriptional regulator [Dictyobacter aurantiacus]|uniref:TetR family transcriptional regulator n=1 Tax=Dictyobacter aurantiacus TaxID=1936993 RepID=A0A401ZNR9_9CHLR|nr:TetR/AcrR family transcriptional regulator [Dictyobacter aurantiacus]GCE08501.1 TetR family transcriptional regulator [Dictyobacter aurantiacus]